MHINVVLSKKGCRISGNLYNVQYNLLEKLFSSTEHIDHPNLDDLVLSRSVHSNIR